MWVKMKFKLYISSLLIILFGKLCFAQNNSLQIKPYLFDVGNDSSLVSEFAIKLTENNLYDKSKQYGWLDENYNEFADNNSFLETVRDDLTYDGISSNEIRFKINLPKGKWFFTFWVKAGYEDKPTTKLLVNDIEKNIVWHELHKIGDADSKNPYDIYRIVHTEIDLKNESLVFNLTNESDRVKILGFSFCPEPEIKNELHKTFYRIIKEAGLYKSKVELSDLALSLKNNFRENQNDPFLFYWFQQVSLLAEGERYLNTRGWEWARQLTGHSIFDRMHQALMLFDTQIENFDTTAYPLLERSLYNRGKLSFDLVLERRGDYQKSIAQKDLNKLYKKYPSDNNLIMLNANILEENELNKLLFNPETYKSIVDQKIDEKDYCDNIPQVKGAPEWSILQREALCRLQSDIKWWVDKRQAPNGELGGKLGDDVEILRWWSTFLMLGDSKTIEGWSKLANAVWNDPKVYLGYSRKAIDVEHSSEFISDSTPELILIDNPKAEEVLTYTAKYFRDLWTSKNKEGRRYFKSAWFSSTEVNESPPRNKDISYNVRAVKPLNFLAWFTRDKEYVQLLSEWAEGWLHAAMSTNKGKPKGVIPVSIRYYDEAINGDVNNWYESNMFWLYFSWTNDAGTRILDQLLFTYTLTGRKEFLKPIELSLELIAKYKNDIDAGKEFIEGSEGWAAFYLSQKIGSLLQNWRMITGNDKYDEFVKSYGNPYVKYRLTKDQNYLVEELEFLLSNIRYNTALRTELVLHTDRVYAPGHQILNDMITGSHSGDIPYSAVTWENAANELTILVKSSNKMSLNVETFSYLDNAQTVIMRPWHLTPGKYKLSIQNDKIIQSETIIIEKPGEKISLSIPSKELVDIVIEKQ